MKHDDILFDFIRHNRLIHAYDYYESVSFYTLYKPGGWFSKKKKIMVISYNGKTANEALQKNQKRPITVFAHDTNIKELIEELDKSLTEADYKVQLILAGPGSI
jgi:hypothetical protein